MSTLLVSSGCRLLSSWALEDQPFFDFEERRGLSLTATHASVDSVGDMDDVGGPSSPTLTRSTSSVSVSTSGGSRRTDMSLIHLPCDIQWWGEKVRFCLLFLSTLSQSL
jgi:hypothetical protein